MEGSRRSRRIHVLHANGTFAFFISELAIRDLTLLPKPTGRSLGQIGADTKKGLGPSSFHRRLIVSVVSITDCQEADEFLDKLSTRGDLFGGQEAVGSRSNKPDAWLFRGVADDDYELIPSALRSENSFARFGFDRCWNSKSQIRAETHTLERFFNLADANGLALPEDSQELRAIIASSRRDKYFDDLDAGHEVWPPKKLWSLLGIAQHYGIPTRLLDWSRRALVAAYFAAEGASKQLSVAQGRLDAVSDSDQRTRAEAEFQRLKQKKLTVWAFAYGKLASWFDMDVRSSFKQSQVAELPLRRVTAPRYQNPNLHAQDGLFTLRVQNLDRSLNQPIKRERLDDIVGALVAAHPDTRLGSVAFFHRIRLPWIRATHLLWLLSKEGVNAASIYPGYKGIVLAMEEEDRVP
jgi:hypothetical protein